MVTAARPAAPVRARSPVAVWLVASVAVGIVLRCWRLGARPLSLDESWEALVARRSPIEIPRFVAHSDTAPPLTYLLRWPFVALQASNTMARLPSVLAAIGALVLFAVWMRRYGVLGVAATALFAVDGFVVHYGREARMYAFLELVGVGAAMTCAAWLRDPRRTHLWMIGAITLAAVFLHVEGLFLALGVFSLAGLRRDRDAWEWRAAVATPVAVFAVLWAWALRIQVHHDHQPGRHTSVSAVIDVIGALVTSSAALRLLGAVAVAFGGVLLVRRHSVLGRAWLACFVVPVAAALVAAVPLDILFPRSFAFAAWAPLVALAALVEAAAARRVALGVAAGVIVVVCALPAGVDAPGYRGPAARAVEQLRRVTRPGDAIAVRPFWLGYLVEWNVGPRRPLHISPVGVLGVDDAHVTTVPGGRPTGRVWLLEPADASTPDVDGRPCAHPWSDGVSRLRCFRT